jgi:hypothetical protein
LLDYAAAVHAGAEVVHPLTNEPWGYGASSPATQMVTCSTCWVTAETVLRST